MSSTKIINVLKDDQFEELLGIVKETDASEVIFVLPKKAKAFKSESQFAALEKESKRTDKAIAFLCSNPETSELARKYNFGVLSARSESSKPKPDKPKPIIVSAVARDDDSDSSEEEQDEEIEDYAEEKLDEENTEKRAEETEDERDYKEDETESEPTEEEPLYGTKVDDEGNIVYEEEEENIGEQISSKKSGDDFQIITASSKTRGMNDVIRHSAGRNLKIAQKNKRAINIETKKDDEIQKVWGSGSSDNIWSDIAKPRSSAGKFKPPFFSQLRPFGRYRLKGNRERIGILSLAVILVLSFIIYLTTGNARIEIKPKPQKLNVQLKVAISPEFSSVNESLNRIPGQLFNISKSASDEFSATAEQDAVQKSRGIITIYNEYSTSPQPLIATTRFEYVQAGKESGLIFRTLQTVTVPGMKVENGVITPGKITVGVIADKAGQTYNVPAGDFGIVSWREKGDNARYAKIYGKSSEAMHGGILGKAKVVSEFDYNNARDQLVARVKNDISETLRAQSAGLELIASIEPKIDSTEDSAKIDDAAETFSVTINGSVATIGFRKDDLLSLVTNYIGKTKGLMVVPEKLELSYKDTAINPADGVLKVTVEISGNAYAKINQEEIVANLTGKNENQIKNYLGSIKDIDSAKVILSPFWVNKVPRNKNKISVELVFI